MDKTQILETFNKHFLEFVDDVQRVVPNNSEIMTARKAISKSLVFFPKMLIKLFLDHVVAVYESQIAAGDLDFFIHKNYRSDLANYDGNANAILEKIDVLREPIRNMSPEEQAKVIKYLQNLTKLSLMYSK
jgi:hypothetical protein